MNPNSFPGLIDNLNGAPATVEDREKRRAAALAESPERRPNRLVLFSDASVVWYTAQNGQSAYNVGIAVAWQENQNGIWVWREVRQVLDAGHFGPRRSDRAEFEAVALGISEVAYNLVQRGSYETVVLYSDSNNALQWLRDPHHNNVFDTAHDRLIAMNSAAKAIKVRGVSVIELKWIPRSFNSIGIPGNIWADCWAHITTGHIPGDGIRWERRANLPEEYRHWHWFKDQMVQQRVWPQAWN